MPNPFTITTAADSVRLDSQGRGSTTFTVSNRSGQPRRGRARPVPSSPEQASWLSVDGEAERSFSPDGTQQYTVRVASPPGAPTGRYTFGLDVVSVENPDEEWSQGPKVSFEIPATPSPKKKPFPWWILAVVAALLLVGGVVFWLLSRDGKPKDSPEPQKAGLLGECKQDADCAEGLGCATEVPGQPGRCRGKLGFGSCSVKDDCQEGLVCEERVCRAPLRSSCQKEGDCAQGLTCSNGSCLAREGSACKAREDCTTGACSQGICVSDSLLQPCQSAADCAAGQSCGTSRRCQFESGQPCSGALECLSGKCASGTCIKGSVPKPTIPATPSKPVGSVPEPSKPAKPVVSSTVVDKGCKGDSDCAKGLTCSGGKCLGRLGTECKGPGTCAESLECAGSCPGPLAGPLNRPQRCAVDSDCKNHACAKRHCLKRDGQKCKDDSECASDNCPMFTRICM